MIINAEITGFARHIIGACNQKMWVGIRRKVSTDAHFDQMEGVAA